MTDTMDSKLLGPRSKFQENYLSSNANIIVAGGELRPR